MRLSCDSRNLWSMDNPRARQWISWSRKNCRQGTWGAVRLSIRPAIERFQLNDNKSGQRFNVCWLISSKLADVGLEESSAISSFRVWSQLRCHEFDNLGASQPSNLKLVSWRIIRCKEIPFSTFAATEMASGRYYTSCGHTASV